MATRVHPADHPGPAVQLGRPVDAAISRPPHPVVQATALRAPTSEMRVVQATVISAPAAYPAPQPQVMNYMGESPYAGPAHAAYADEQDTICLQFGTAYACCCPCGLCVGCALYSMHRDKPLGSPHRVWGQYALAAGVFNVTCSLAAAAARTFLM
uniref:Uncharacterized protein n=1 Tax=Pyrodinium bahamense TaxID=73915 RepID=A0A7R9ZYI9_9DINO|mmetsp:Transcript_15247/g.42110  ORF Transcript_15247/g.42110 Transcript_15247/m.42110 type:complete len:155 (+) Transcript_15247:113-577(+)